MNLSFLIGHLRELGGRTETTSQPRQKDGGQAADKVVASFFREKKYLGGHDRRFITEHFYAILRHRRRLETLLERYIQEIPDAAALNTSPQHYISLYLAYRIVVEHEAGETTFHSLEPLWKEHFPSVDRAAFVSWLEQHREFEHYPQDNIANMGIKYSFQDWMVKEWYQEFGPEADHLLQAMNTPASTTIRVNLLKTNREECRKRLLKEGIETELTPFSPAGLIVRKRFNRDISKTFKDGWYEFQDEGSQLISYCAAPKAGMFVVDACAGAGGKTLHLAELMKNSGKIIAVDVEQKRLDELSERAERAGVKIIQTLHRDAVRSDVFIGKADLVLIDAPCSGSGTIRRNPDKKWTTTESLVQQYAEEQRKILELNFNFVKNNGSLVYATCSLFRAENEKVLNSFLNDHKNFELVKPGQILKSINITSDTSTVTLLPHRHNTDGFFVAGMQRTE